MIPQIRLKVISSISHIDIMEIVEEKPNVEDKPKVSVITLLHGEKEFVPLILHNYQNFLQNQELELVVVDDGKESLALQFADVENCLYLHLDQAEITDFFKKIVDGYKQPNKTPLYYQRKLQTLPNGFKRDYGCGLASGEYMFHMNADCVYNPKAIDRKIRFMKRVGAECTYCDTMLCYDIYNKKLYKSISKYKIYEATLCHSQEFWKRRGFQWSDVEAEGKYFHYNNGSDRKQDNYYDTIVLLSIHNMNGYQPAEVTLDGIDIKIPDIVSEIKVETHPFVNTMNDLYGKDEISLLGINSEFLENVTQETWSTHNITDKWKQTKLASKVKQIDTSFNVLLYGSKHPAWDLFEHVPFDLIMLETHKNQEQMMGIIASCKTHEYVSVKGVYVRKEFLGQDEGSELPISAPTPTERPDTESQ